MVITFVFLDYKKKNASGKKYTVDNQLLKKLPVGTNGNILINTATEKMLAELKIFFPLITFKKLDIKNIDI